jgi:quaternary ammonium compound-resistance protein SugE
MYWLWLLAAGVLEICFVVLLKLSDGMTKAIPTIGFAIVSLLSFLLLTKAMQGIPTGTAYAVWTGIGASGTMIIGVCFFGEQLSALRVLFFLLLLVGIAGLKFTLPDA